MGQGSIIGYEINEKTCQISYYSEEQMEPQTLEVDEDNFQIPLIIGRLRDTWAYGKEAKRLATVKEGFTVTRLLNRGNFLVAREEMKDFKWTDLKGKDVLGGRKGGMPEMVFEYILKQNGIDPRTDLNINQGIDFGSTAAAFSEGSGNFTVEFEPSATALESEGKGHVVASLGTDSGYVPYTAYSAKKSYLDKNPDVIQSFTNALQKGMDFVQNHTPEEIAAVIAPQFPETDLNTITTIVTRYYDQKTWKEDLIFEKDSFELLQDILESAAVVLFPVRSPRILQKVQEWKRRCRRQKNI